MSAVSAAAASAGSPAISGTSRSTALIAPIRPSAAIAARRSGGGAPSAIEARHRLLERGEAQAPGGVERGGRHARIAVAEPAVHERQEPQVAERAAHRGEHAAPIGGGVGDARGLEQRERGALGDIPARAERAPGEIAEQPARGEPRGAGGREGGGGREDLQRLGGRGLAALEAGGAARSRSAWCPPLPWFPSLPSAPSRSTVL